jgi:hypothetical protein
MKMLRAGLEVLHEQSLEWLSEIACMKEEVVFFNTLVNKNTIHFPTSQSAELDKELITFNSDMLTGLHNKIMEHERWLADIIRTDTLSRQEFYREIHCELTAQMDACREKFIQIKKRIFSLVKKHQENLGVG